MAYDPFVRGVRPVGVRSAQLIDPQRANRPLLLEVWYPADSRYAGQDLDTNTQDAFTVLPLRQAAVRDATVDAGAYPLVLFSHTSAGHRRQSTFLCTHLASHGYVVAAVDHTGNTAAAERATTGKTLTPAERDAYIEQIIADRVPDLCFLLDQVLAGAAGDVSPHIDEQRIGMIGWSFGGWTVLAALETDDRCRAVVALAPGGNSKPLPGIIPATLTFAWKREVPTLLLVAEDDRFTPMPGQYELFARTPSSKQMFILRGADHLHFGDQIDEPEGCPAEDAHTFTRGLALAHLDAVLKHNLAAQHFMAEEAPAALRDRGVHANQYAPNADSCN
jgi:predicted dienelactone hydrolase